ncbi:hypothetical protein L1987_23267 [Smallanthus sonchifolius]|uniref:Uncharacterized protein n=1 Tax=Smallanthus sonchifolius TaxID=185202 RepID=A0ACB9IIM4_9ASTR|nr:hypothetical protein L1987_23267 [Smallanthus sonchifolius]
MSSARSHVNSADNNTKEPLEHSDSSRGISMTRSLSIHVADAFPTLVAQIKEVVRKDTENSEGGGRNSGTNGETNGRNGNRKGCPYKGFTASKRVERCIYGLTSLIRGVVTANELSTMKAAIQLAGSLTDGVVRDGVLTRKGSGEKRK